MLLLHLMAVLFPHRMRAIYVNHQLQSVSDEWADFVMQQCQKLDIPCVIQRVSVGEGNIENQAREARYSAFVKHLQPQEILVLAHHQQDQAETLLLRLLSGAGVQGLAAMRAVDIQQKAGSKITLWRPLLDLSREQISQWVQQLNICYVDDLTNLDVQYDRAWCRHELWNILQSRFPKMQQALSRTSKLMQDADEILKDVLNQDLESCGTAEQLDLAQLQKLSEARQRQLLSTWMKGKQQYRPPFEMVQRLQQEVIFAREDAQSALHYNEHYYVRYRGTLYCLAQHIYLADRQQATEEIRAIIFDTDKVVTLASGQYAIKASKFGLSPTLLGKNMQLHPRQGGEKIHLYGRVGSWPLKKAIQDAHIFPWMRHTIQILSMDNVMLGVFTPKGFWLAQSEYCIDGGWQPDLIS